MLGKQLNSTSLSHSPFFLLDLASPILEELEKYTIKSPSLSYYVLQAFTNWTWVTILLRIVDAFTDITLTIKYFEDFDSVVNETIGNTLSFQPGNSSCLDIACVKDLCNGSLTNDIWKRKLICTFPLMQWWISGTLSVVVLAITYLAEVISSIVSKKFNHYLALYSRVCCKEHHWRTVFFHAMLLPLGQQMATLIYSHWIKTFVGYWQSKNTEMIANLPSKNNECIKHCEQDRAEGELVKKIMYYSS